MFRMVWVINYNRARVFEYRLGLFKPDAVLGPVTPVLPLIPLERKHI